MATIVIADDDPFLTKIYSTRLSKDGHTVEAVGDGEAALAKARELKPELVVLDIMLPKLSGLDVLTALKADPKTAKIPVVVLSNLTSPEEQEEAVKRGAVEFLAKVKFTPSQVVEAIEKHLSKNLKSQNAEVKAAA